MNEAENQVIPNEEDAFALDLDDIKEAEANEDEEDSLIATGEETPEPTDEEVSTPTETETEEQEIDFTPLLNKLSKDIKYMDQEVKIESLEDVVKNYQKGLDYDRKVEKLKELENSEVLTYIKDLAKENGMTPEEFIKQDREAKQQMIKEQEEAELNEMINNGVAEEIAKKVIETNRIARELQQEKLRRQEEEAKQEANRKKEAENEEFISAYPDVDIKSIPKEVFVEAEKIGLLPAYIKYENAKLKTDLEILKKNKENENSSPVKGTTEHGGVVIEKQDDFLKGLGL